MCVCSIFSQNCTNIMNIVASQLRDRETASLSYCSTPPILTLPSDATHTHTHMPTQEWTGADCNTSRLQSLEGSGSGQLPIYPTFTTPQSLQPSLVSSPSPSITDSSSSAWAVSGSPSVQNETSTATNDSQCVCRKQCPDEGATKNCSAEAGLGVVDACNSSRNQTQ